MAVTTKVPNHAHCTQCGRAVPFGDKTCGPECDQQIAAANKQRKKMMYITYGLLIGGFLLLVLGPQLFQGTG